MRKLITRIVIGGVATCAIGVPLAASASAAPSECGAAHGAFANVNGNFGWLGDVGGTPGYHNGATGANEPGSTGANNSGLAGLCANR